MREVIDQKGVVASEVAHLRKHRDLIIMKPSPGTSISLMARQVYTSLLAVGQAQAQQRPGGMLASDKFRAPFGEILANVGLGEAQRQVTKAYVKEMEERRIVWSSANADAPYIDIGLMEGDEVLDISFPMLVEPTFIKDKSGRLIFEWTFAPWVHKRLLIEDPRVDHFGIVQLKAISLLSTHAALALYEICCKFKYRDADIGETARKTPQWWTDALSGSSPKKGESRRPWVKFKSEKVLPAIADVNLHSDIEVALHEDKNRGEIYFVVKKKARGFSAAARLSSNDGAATVQESTLLRCVKHGVPEKKAARLVAKYGEKKLIDVLVLLEQRNNAVSEPIRSSFAWIDQVLKNNQTEAPLLDNPQNEPEEEGAQDMPKKESRPPPKSIGTLAAERQAEVTKKMFEEVNRLPQAERKRLIEAAKLQLIAGGFPPRPTDLKRVEGLNVPSQGIIGSKVVDIYATGIYGEKWRDMIELEQLGS